MTSLHCINNRNFKIIAAYVKKHLGTLDPLFADLSYPDRFSSPEDFFLNEDEWTTYENFSLVLRRGKQLLNEPDFFFQCGLSSATLQSWGRIYYFARIFASPGDGFQRIPFFNRQFNDTKDIEVLLPPHYDREQQRMRTILLARFHEDFDANQDYIGDPYLRGILAGIPVLWDMAPATVHQPLLAYDPEILFNQDPEFSHLRLDVRLEGTRLSLRHPETGLRTVVGEKVLLERQTLQGKEAWLGAYTPWREQNPGRGQALEPEAIRISQTIEVEGRILLHEGEIFKAPYNILDIHYDNPSFLRRIGHIFIFRKRRKETGEELFETINQLRKSMMARNEANLRLEKTNQELREAKERLDAYNRELEHRVEQRTIELEEARDELLRLNQDLEAQVREKVAQLERHHELRRYLSPKLAERILSSDQGLGHEPQRKMMTVVFTDIRGFSALTDSLEPEEAFPLLTRYLTEMTQIVHRHDGTLNKITGDGLLIFFGDPLPMEDHAERAVRMAIEMQEKVRDLREEWMQYGNELGVGIGINTGFVTVGNVGSDLHKDYTVIGNQVNVAARLESEARAGDILISQRTYSKVRNLIQAEPMGEIQVKGIHYPIQVYRVRW